MANIIRFADGVMVEVAPNPTPGEPVSGRSVERTSQAFQAAAEVVGLALKSVVSSVQRAVRESGASTAELEFGVGFSVEGNVYVTKISGEGNLTVKVTIDGNHS